MTDDLNYWAIAFGDQEEAEIVSKGTDYAQTALTEVGMSLADLSEDEREILTLGIRVGAIAHLARSRGQR